jgi:FdrA protein
VIERVEVRRGTYYDSVSLMMLSRDATALDGVIDVAVVVATPLNLDLLARQGYELPGDPPGTNDLVLAVRARDERALVAVDELVDGWSTRGSGDRAVQDEREPFRNVRALGRREPEVNLLIVSVPGRHAAYEVAAGLEAGMHVFCFSSGMSPADERALKELAAQRGLLLLGPDCGTAILDGVGVGFANAVEPGPVGIVGASGTGIQEVSCLLDAAGVGISQAIGVGARDLSAEIGGGMTHRALDILFEDPGTQTIVVLSKPIGPDATSSLLAHASEGPKPVVLGLLGADPADPAERGSGTVYLVVSLEAAATAAAAIHDRSLPNDDVVEPERTPGFVRGLFCGGSLCHEAAGVAAKALGGVWSNITITGGAMVPDVWESVEHTFLDLGDEALTQGRLHPMIDPTLRNERALREGLDPSVGVLLMDVVLGFGAHPDPAKALAPLVAELLDTRAGSLSVVVSLCGTDLDLQDSGDQRRRLEAAGATVTRSAAGAARIAVAASGAGPSSGEPGAVR